MKYFAAFPEEGIDIGSGVHWSCQNFGMFVGRLCFSD